MKPAPLTLAESIPHACTVMDMCRLLQLSPSRFYELLKLQRLPFTEIEPRIGGPRFSGADVRLWLDGFYAERPRLKAVK